MLIVAEAHTILYKPVAEIVNDDEGECTYVGDFNRYGRNESSGCEQGSITDARVDASAR